VLSLSRLQTAVSWLFGLALGATVVLTPTRSLHGDAPPAPVAGPLAFSRLQVTPGNPQRDWTYVWSRSGVPAGPISLTAPGQEPIPCERLLLGWPAWQGDEVYHAGIRVPANMADGVYFLRFGEVTTNHRLTVVNRRPLTHCAVATGGQDAERIEKALADHDTVTLLPGLFRLDRAVRVPPGRTLRGAGAVLTKTKNPADRFDCMFIPGDDCTFEGLTFRGNDAVMFNDDAGRNVVIDQCILEDCQLGYWVNDGLLVDRCRFIRASAGIVRCGLWHRCRWEGLSRHFHAWIAWGQPDPRIRPAVVDCVFDGTDRGPGLTSNWGDLSDSLIHSVEVRSVSRVYGGNEIFGFEVGGTKKGLRRLLAMHVRAYNCEGQVQFWTGEVTDCLLRNLVLDGPSLAFSAADGSSQTGNVIEESEFRGGGIHFAPTAINNEVRRCGFTGWRPTRANVEMRAGTYALTGRSVIESTGPQAVTNRVTACQASALPAGVAIATSPAVDPVSPRRP
jgi:hypothetical protein